MALATSARRDQRRRLVASWNRSASGPAESDTSPPTPGRVADYDDAARPERHPGLATRLPTTLGGLVLASAAILVGMGGVIALAISGPLLGRQLFEGGGRFAKTIGIVKQSVHPSTPLPVHAWLAVLALFASAAIAGSIKHMRRHRRDDYKGRFRAWGWLATIFTLAAWSAVLPIGPLVATFLGETTGLALGPGGIGWWYGLAACGCVIVVPWADFPLRQRLGAAMWMVLAMLAWSTAAAMPWVPTWVGGAERGGVIATVAWAAGAAFSLVAMLTAARGVIREVRGDVVAVPPKSTRRDRKRNREVEETTVADDAEENADEQSDVDEANLESDRDDDAQTNFIDGSDGGERRLSKAERKRLKKLARMNGYAA